MQRPLAEGGFGAVYDAVQVDLGRHVALKILKSTAFEQNHAVERFLREAKGTAALDHPHIVRIFDHGVEDGVPWIAYEFCGGGTLSGTLKRGAMEWRRAIWTIRQVCLGLEHAHQNNILHRDMKPANVLLTEAGQAKVADFGLAKWNIEATILTETGAVLGTPYYMAPELLEGESSAASDQYAVAVMFFEMITGRRLFLAETPVQVLLKHANGERTPPSQAADLPADLDAPVLKALSRLPGDRFPDLAAFRQALEALAPETTRTTPLQLADIEKAKPSRPTARRSRPTSRPPDLPTSRPPDLPTSRRRWLVAALALPILAALAYHRVPRTDGGAVAASMLTSVAPAFDLEAVERERATLRAKADSVGLIGTMMFEAIRPGGSPAAMREPMERAMATHREVVRRAEDALEPFEVNGVRAGAWSHRAAEVAARLSTIALMSRMDVDRGNRFLPRLSTKQDGDFLGTSAAIMLSQEFSRKLLGDLHRQHDWVAVLVTQADADPTAAGPHTVWALLDLLRPAKQYSQTPIEGFNAKELIAHARERFAKGITAKTLHGQSLARLASTLFTVGVQGNVPASVALVDQIAADAGALVTAMPGAAEALRSLPLRVRSLYPPRGAPGATVTADWPFAP